MRAVDTNVLVRLIARDDPKQAAAADAFVAQGAWVSHVVLVETVWVLGSVFSRADEALAACVRMLLQHQSLVVQDPDVVEAALARFEGGGVGFSDCLILEIARKAGHAPLGSFDRELAKLDGVEKL